MGNSSNGRERNPTSDSTTPHTSLEPLSSGAESMIIQDRKYLKPSTEARELALLDCLQSDAHMSQGELAQRMRISGAMVNKYLKELQHRGWVEYTPVNGKSYRYDLTDEGKSMRRTMFSDFSNETIQLYTALKMMVRQRLAPLAERGIKRVAVFGAAETCEVVLSAMKDMSFSIVALLDNSQDKQGKNFFGYVVSPPQVLSSIDCEAVVIASYGRQEEIRRQLIPLQESKGLEIVQL